MAVAGTVAPVFKGEYNSTAIYDFYNVVNHNNKMWICKVDGTVGIEPTEDNSDYWYLAIDGTNAASLGGETAEAWQTKIDNIQTTSSGTLSEVGWYRVAEYKATSELALKGYRTNSCEIIIKREHSSTFSEYHELTFSTVTENMKFINRLNKSLVQIITQIRYVYDSANYIGFIEVYYNSSLENLCHFEINHPSDGKGTWQAITPVLTKEIIDGVTVTTTYDIPANANPVTDLDLKAFKNTNVNLTTVEAIEEYFNTYSETLDTHTIFQFDTQLSVAWQELTAGGYKVIGKKESLDYEWQIAVGTWQKIFYRRKINGTWDTGWKVLATTADLANYLPLSGGEIAKPAYAPLQINNTSTSSSSVGLEFRSQGEAVGYYGFDDNKKAVVYEDGVKSDILNSSNFSDYALPLDGSKAMTGQLRLLNDYGAIGADGNHAYLSANSPSNTSHYRNIRILNSDHTPDGINALEYLDATSDSAIIYKILHTGNSNAVISASSAPSNTSALWYDTTNKVLKRYVDGAWQQ